MFLCTVHFLIAFKPGVLNHFIHVLDLKTFFILYRNYARCILLRMFLQFAQFELECHTFNRNKILNVQLFIDVLISL